MTDKQLDELLQNRRTPQAPEGLSERIVASSYRAQDAKTKNTKTAQSGIFAEISRLFLIPKPAYAFAVLFVLGVMAGMQIDVSASADTMLTEDISGFMQIDAVWSDDYTIGEEEV